MPQRKSTKRISSEAVQGEGSYVVLKKLTVGMWKELRTQANSPDADSTTHMNIDLETIRDHVVEWNWVGDDGEPWPVPSQDESVLETLTIDEKSFLIGALFGSEEERKN